MDNRSENPAGGGSAEAENRVTLFYGPIGENAYPKYVRDQIEKKFGNPEDQKARSDREAMWRNYRGLEDTLRQQPDRDAVAVTYGYIKGLNDFTKGQLENRPAGGLGRHLKEVEEFPTEFLFDSQGESRFPSVISTRETQLFVNVIAPMHDVLKFLGTYDAQVTPDHEIMIKKLVTDHFTGKHVKLAGKQETLTQEDTAFIAGIVGDHENIYKEEGRANFINSDSRLERAKALFFVADTLTGAIRLNNDGSFSIDRDQLRTRFTDLYFRHIDLEKGKVFRPQWGESSIGDLLSTITTLEKSGLQFAATPDGKKTQDILIDAGLEAITHARIKNAEREGKGKQFDNDQLEAIDKAEQKLKGLKKS